MTSDHITLRQVQYMTTCGRQVRLLTAMGVIVLDLTVMGRVGVWSEMCG